MTLRTVQTGIQPRLPGAHDRRRHSPAVFHPFAYAVDALLPIVDLRQKSSSQPQGSAMYWSWALTALSCILTTTTTTTTAVAALTGILRRD